MMRQQQQNGDVRVPVDSRLWPLFDDLLIIAGHEEKCQGPLPRQIVEDLTFVVRSLCRRVANQQLKEKCISLVGGSNEPHCAPLMVSCGPENFNKPGDLWKSSPLTLQEFNWTLIIEAKNANECMSFIQVEPVNANTVWSCTARFSLMINNINFECTDVDFNFNNNRVAIPWKNSPQPGLVPRSQMRSPLKVQMSKVGVRVLPTPDFVTVSPDDANTSIYVEGKPVPVNYQLISYHCPMLRGLSVVDGKVNLPGFTITPFRSFLDNLINNAPVNASNVASLLDVSSSLQCVLVRERCEQFLVQTTELPFPQKLDLATRYKLAIAQAYCLAVIRNAKEVEEARSDPEFEKMSDMAKTAFAMKEKSLGLTPSVPIPAVAQQQPAQQQQRQQAQPFQQQQNQNQQQTVRQEKKEAPASGNNDQKKGGSGKPNIPSLLAMNSAPAAGPGPVRGPGGPGPVGPGPLGMGPGPMGPGGPGPMGMGGPGPMGPGPMGPGPMGMMRGGPMGMRGPMGPGPMRGGMMGPGPMRGPMGRMGPGGPMGRVGPMRGGIMKMGKVEERKPAKRGSGGRALKV